MRSKNTAASAAALPGTRLLTLPQVLPSLLLLLLLLMPVPLLGGCAWVPAAETAEEPVSGGNTYRRDENAPTSIESAQITAFDAAFYLNTRWNCEGGGLFHFTVKTGDDNVSDAVTDDGTSGSIAVVSEEELGISLPADSKEDADALLSALQSIIEENDLVSLNGIYDVTAGLAPEYQPGGLRVSYASGETLEFTTDNNPYALWSEQMYDVLAAWFAAKGDASLLPPPEDSQVTRLRLDFVDHENRYRYGGITMGDRYLFHREISETAAARTLSDRYIPFPDDFFASVTPILSRCDVALKYDYSRYDRAARNYGNHEEGYFGFGPLTTADGEEDSEDMSLSLHLEYESGNRISIDTRKASEIDAMRPMLTELMEYMDSLF